MSFVLLVACLILYPIFLGKLISDSSSRTESLTKVEVWTGLNSPFGKFQYFSLDSTGFGSYYEYNRDTDSSIETNMTFSNEELESLFDTVLTNNFFELESLYVNTIIADGFATTILIRSSNAENAVRVQNIEQSEFERILRELNRMLLLHNIELF